MCLSAALVPCKTVPDSRYIVCCRALPNCFPNPSRLEGSKGWLYWEVGVPWWGVWVLKTSVAMLNGNNQWFSTTGNVYKNTQINWWGFFTSHKAHYGPLTYSTQTGDLVSKYVLIKQCATIWGLSSVAYRCPDSPEDPWDIPGSSLVVPPHTALQAVRRIPRTSQDPP